MVHSDSEIHAEISGLRVLEIAGGMKLHSTGPLADLGSSNSNNSGEQMSRNQYLNVLSACQFVQTIAAAAYAHSFSRPCELGLGECIRQSAARKQSRKVRVSISMVYVTIAVLSWFALLHSGLCQAADMGQHYSKLIPHADTGGCDPQAKAWPASPYT